MRTPLATWNPDREEWETGQMNLLSGHGAWDSYEPGLWPGGVMDHQYKSLLHSIGVSYNNAPAGTTSACPRPFSRAWPTMCRRASVWSTARRWS